MKPGLMGISALLLAVEQAPVVAAEPDWGREAEDRAQMEKAIGSMFAPWTHTTPKLMPRYSHRTDSSGI